VLFLGTVSRGGFTWIDEGAADFWPGHLDYLIYSDSVLELANSYLVYTPDMSIERLAQYALNAGDSLASDHLLFVADFRMRPFDEDTNELPDFWERREFGALGITDGKTDSDLDGMSNRSEYLAGTDPEDSASFLFLDPSIISETEVELRWSTERDKRYMLQSSTTLLNWGIRGIEIEGSGEEAIRSEQIGTGIGDLYFYRILVAD
jgi:hypothetical protein